MRHSNLIILTDDAEFARLLSACWQAERQAPTITVLSSTTWESAGHGRCDLVVIGPLQGAKISSVLRAIEPACAVILCVQAESGELTQLRTRYPRLVHVPFREDWAQTLVLVAGESLRRAEATKLARQAELRATRSEQYAVLGRYMIEMKHTMNNALTSILGNAELLLLEPGQLSAQSLAQIRTMHSMTLRINEVMQRFSSLATEMREAENASQAETDEAAEPVFRKL
ncbi:MAG: hypothetical protein NVS9B14_05280 [Candidatus Acidiferrum sp.]